MIDKDIENAKFLIRDLKAMSYNETFINSISNVLSELETWKKIAEKLAEHISERCLYIDDYSNNCDVIEDSCYEDKDCKQCIIDRARKEVGKDE